MITALLARVSTLEQASHGHSIGEQIDRMRSYCDAMGWNNIKEYVDAGYTGSNMDRPALQRLILDSRSGKIKRVIVYKLDRLSRSQRDTLTLIEDEFLANDVDFISITENFDTSTPFGRAMIGILAVFAQLERETIKERMIMGLDARAKKGRPHISYRVPIGYKMINGDLMIDPYEALQVKRMFEEYARGKSCYKIAQDLNRDGFQHRNGDWKQDTIRKIITKQTYIGKIKHHDEWINGVHEPIIDEDLFWQCQKEWERRHTDYMTKHRRAGKATSYLGGFLYCAHCGAKYNRNHYIHKRGNRSYDYDYYKCNSRSKRSKKLIIDRNCKNRNWKIDNLDSLVFDEIRKLALEPLEIPPVQDDTPIIREEIKKIDAKMDRLMDLYSIGEIPVDMIQTRIKDLQDQKEKLEDSLIMPEKITLEESIKTASSFNDILDGGDMDEIRTVIGTLIDKIVLDGDDVTIYWKFL